MKSNCSFISEQTNLLLAARPKPKPENRGAWLAQLEALHGRLLTGIDFEMGEWEHLRTTWKAMPDELRKEENNRKLIKGNARKAREQLESARYGSRKWEEKRHAADVENQNEIGVDEVWIRTPKVRRDDSRAQQTLIRDRITTAREEEAAVQRLLAACQQRILPLELAIMDRNTRIEEDDDDLQRIKARRLSLAKSMSSRNVEYNQQSVEERRRRQRLSEVELTDLNIRHENVVQQQGEHLWELHEAGNNPQLAYEKIQAADVLSLAVSWKAFVQSQSNLRGNWEANKEQWQLVAERRKVDHERKPNVGVSLLVVVSGMLFC